METGIGMAESLNYSPVWGDTALVEILRVHLTSFKQILPSLDFRLGCVYWLDTHREYS